MPAEPRQSKKRFIHSYTYDLLKSAVQIAFGAILGAVSVLQYTYKPPSAPISNSLGNPALGLATSSLPRELSQTSQLTKQQEGGGVDLPAVQTAMKPEIPNRLPFPPLGLPQNNSTMVVDRFYIPGSPSANQKGQIPTTIVDRYYLPTPPHLNNASTPKSLAPNFPPSEIKALPRLPQPKANYPEVDSQSYNRSATASNRNQLPRLAYSELPVSPRPAYKLLGVLEL
ncbi:MAG: hypothetical protein VKJ46_15375, partial [Leptolyngbyaceae bacterium]|nr:hypothetical protein [Leptolyngbyaceae bacterium]